MILVLALVLALLLGCSDPPCPTDRLIEESDLPCTCGIQPVEEMTCEDLYCTEDGAIQGAGNCT